MVNIRQDAARRTAAKTLTISGTATGSSTDDIRYGQGGYSLYGVASIITGSTKGTTGNFAVEGSVGNSSVWTKLMAVDSPSTVGAIVNTTAALVVDRIRITSSSMSGSSTEVGFVLSVTVVPSVGA